ncbi:peptide methionine sulfoxide reductase [Putridiphycobacter roseus]|uniref:peptide-methionine (S)-S-oxide reductase n=1 Tax=Putridiphycobacter roseus TaxID=2219161 RepID=A0A2W1NIJ3_9FLAO|nr:peptide-methionine (S)-S-oxide reductase [Putridiphycobacter roseus]PZE17746.1 peptide methionine sulfoxide reductase [Putridiphycobacter roseus]
MSNHQKIGLGGGCHWCTEGVFHALIGVNKVEQGWISSAKPNEAFSEGVIVHFDSSIISLETLIEIHLHTHAATSNHKMRKKYRSAIYFFNENQQITIAKSLTDLESTFPKPIITLVLQFVDFRLNKEEQLNYFLSKPNQPFCITYIHPKLTLLRNEYSNYVNHQKLKSLNV